ncbi:unnamed protein product [Adineta steineri]|uniref:PX domain-containing protein n=1 Tax=Adineta steineri TaxID=433720 RepID=A0A814SVF8_9BILA|nr:unnamed protein product [Adineta steineri]CAF3535113.1 unnamed protein product [Adineta steineri]
MDDPLSRALREENNPPSSSSSIDTNDLHFNEKISSLSISHSHNDWILPSTNERKEEVEINREYIKICVCDPKKHKSNLDSYVTYLVNTQTYNDSVKINETNVRRRYNDFIWLKNLLDMKYPFNIISPLPAKHTLSNKLHVVADDGEFIRRRMIGLQNFLQRIIDNPVISIDSSVQLFLSADDDTLHTAQQQQTQATTISSVSPHISSTNSNPFRQPMGRGKPIPSEFSRTENQIQTLQDNLRKLERLTRKIETDQVSIQTEEEHLLSTFKQWLDIERKYDENDSFIDIVSSTQEKIVENQMDLLKYTNTKFIEPINEYVLFTNVVQDVLKRRAQLSENVTTNNSEEMFDQLTIANETIKADIHRWTELKDKELTHLFHLMANKKIDFYNQSIDAWEQAAARLSLPNNQK